MSNVVKKRRRVWTCPSSQLMSFCLRSRLHWCELQKCSRYFMDPRWLKKRAMCRLFSIPNWLPEESTSMALKVSWTLLLELPIHWLRVPSQLIKWNQVLWTSIREQRMYLIYTFQHSDTKSWSYSASYYATVKDDPELHVKLTGSWETLIGEQDTFCTCCSFLFLGYILIWEW